MKMDDFALVSVDDHLAEPPDMFKNHIPARYRDLAPTVIQRADGTDAWVFEGQALELEGVPDADADKITHLNALRLFGGDLFSHLSREQATVGALRARTRDIDLGFRSSERLRKTGPDTVTVLDLARQLPTPR